MEARPHESLEPTPEQLRYAAVLEKGMYVGLACLLVTFALYVFGVMDPHIPLGELPEHWSKSAHDYLIEANIKAGWGWLEKLGHGDFVNFIGLAILAGVTIVCYLAVLPVMLKNNDKLYAVLVLLEVVVLVVAASGILNIFGKGGH